MSFAPTGASGTVSYSGSPPSGLTYGGSCFVGVCFYKDGSRLVYGSGNDYLVIAQSSQYSRLLPYGYYGGRYNAAMDGSCTVRMDYSTAYIYAAVSPDAIGLMVRVVKGSFSFSGRLMLLW